MLRIVLLKHSLVTKSVRILQNDAIIKLVYVEAGNSKDLKC